mgnify:CR=1 FL=1
MPWSTEQKQMTRERILGSAIKLFSARGFDNVTINNVMQEAQLTHGAFYAHFSSKNELYTEAITAATKHSILANAQEEDGCENLNVSKLIAAYLDIDHVQQKAPPCPLAFLATDVASRDKEVRLAYTKVYKDLIYTLNKQLNHLPSRSERALALSALMIGGVAISRALDDEQAVNDLLGACRKFGTELIDGSDAGT